jgi:hypothetical protein
MSGKGALYTMSISDWRGLVSNHRPLACEARRQSRSRGAKDPQIRRLGSGSRGGLLVAVLEDSATFGPRNDPTTMWLLDGAPVHAIGRVEGASHAAPTPAVFDPSANQLAPHEHA